MPDADMKGWKAAEGHGGSDREFLVSYLRASQPGDEEEDWFGVHQDKLGRESVQKGINITDLTQEDGAYDWYLRTASFPFWNLPFAAFLLEGYGISTDAAGPALLRLRRLGHDNSAIAELLRTYERLQAISEDPLTIDPAKVFAAFMAHTAPTPQLVTMLWAMREKLAARFATERADLEARWKTVQRLETETLRAGTAVYILAVREGWEKGEELQPAAKALLKGLEDGLEKLNAQRAAKGLGPVPWTPPVEETLERLLTKQRSIVRQEPAKRGRPKKKDRPKDSG